MAELKGPIEQDAAAAHSYTNSFTAAAAPGSAALDTTSSLACVELAAAAPTEQELQRRQTLCDLQDDIEEVRRVHQAHLT